jgi:hypothetical protein
VPFTANNPGAVGIIVDEQGDATGEEIGEYTRDSHDFSS